MIRDQALKPLPQGPGMAPAETLLDAAAGPAEAPREADDFEDLGEEVHKVGRGAEASCCTPEGTRSISAYCQCPLRLHSRS